MQVDCRQKSRKLEEKKGLCHCTLHKTFLLYYCAIKMECLDIFTKLLHTCSTCVKSDVIITSFFTTRIFFLIHHKICQVNIIWTNLTVQCFCSSFSQGFFFQLDRTQCMLNRHLFNLSWQTDLIKHQFICNLLQLNCTT